MLKHLARMAPELLYDKNRGIILRQYTFTDAKEALVHPADLRARYGFIAWLLQLSNVIIILFCIVDVGARNVSMNSRVNRYFSTRVHILRCKFSL